MAHDIRTFRRDKLRRLVEAGRVVMVASYHFEDQLGESRTSGVAVPVAMMPDDRRTKPGICYLFPSDFTSKSGACYRYAGRDDMVSLNVHSNCNYEFRILDRPVTPGDVPASAPEVR